jgi:hypothetical protein
MPLHAKPVHSDEVDELTADLWDGRISEAKFTDCALEAGVSIKEINAILEEIRNEDEGLT